VLNLMLKEEVLEASRNGQFHIWPIRTIEEGIEVLTGVPAGELQPDGHYPEGTIFALVNKKLTQMAETLLKFKEE